MKKQLKQNFLILFIVLQVAFLIGGIVPFFRSLARYQFSGKELVSNGLFLESFINGLGDGYYVDNSLESSEELFIGIPEIDLRAGSYRVYVTYDTDANEQIYEISSDYNTYSVRAAQSGQALKPDKQHDTFSFETPIKVKGYQVKVKFCGYDYLFINDIIIEETNVWKIKNIISIFTICLILDIIYFLYNKKKSLFHKTNMNVIVSLITMIILSSMPILSEYIFSGHDLGVHLNRIEGVKNALLWGQFPVRMQQSYFAGYGYPISIYYCDLFLYIPALLRIIGYSVQDAYKFYVLMLNAATCLCMFGTVKGIFKNAYLALFASFLYLMAPYRLSSLYLRAAVGEATAMCFYPLIIYGLYRIYTDDLHKRENKNNWIFFSLGFVGLLHCHIISTFIAVFFTALFCIVYIRKTLCKERIVRLLKSVVLAVFLSLWFIVPFLEYMKFDIKVNYLESRGVFASHGVFLSQLLSIFPQGNSCSYSVNDGIHASVEMAFSIGGGLIAAIILYIICCINLPQNRENIDRLGKGCFGFGILSILISTIWFPWDGIEQLNNIFGTVIRSIQYPWRFLSIATLLLTFLAVYIVYWINNNGKTKMFLYHVVSSMLILSFISGNYFISDYMNKIKKDFIIDEDEINVMDAGNGEYIPVNTDSAMFGVDEVLAEKGININTVERYGDILAISCENTTEQEQYIDVPLLYYRDYFAKDMDTGSGLNIGCGEGNRVRVYLPDLYQGNIHIEFVSPWCWRICELVSAVTLLLLILAVYKEYREKRQWNYSGKVKN